jgi:hypothetical protein
VLTDVVTFAVSLVALIAVPPPFLRSLGSGGLRIALLSVLTAVMLVPVILDGRASDLVGGQLGRAQAQSEQWSDECQQHRRARPGDDDRAAHGRTSDPPPRRLGVVGGRPPEPLRR